ncbi:uncharacterized protein LOC117817304 [Notolabrus celidotus]|uniref:uncharacterized protein LOC117817304 n=1 Tax=Notolabrus celidotus TaxID=1203425 RepID=UPI00148FAFDC|nr:uncharacterized protein LOC117817304 [Notolabrus celidotus]XP_034545820.1 uncharacterized protein LOC117817304 [Notolabrus celidotus]
MNKLRTWLSKPKKEAETQLRGRPLTSERTDGDIRILGSAPQKLDAQLLFPREILQEDFGQEPEVSVDPSICRPLQWPVPERSASPPACRSLVQVKNSSGDRMQVKQDTMESSDVISVGPPAIGATNTSPTSPGHFVLPFFKRTDTSSLPSSPYPGGRRLPSSLPCSPLIGGRHWRSSSPSSSSSLSRLCVEEALQRSRNLRQSEPRFTQVREDGEEGRQGETAEEEDCGREREEDEGEEDEDSKHLGLDLWRYCLVTPCVCDRCPSAPPFEADLVSGVQVFPWFSHSLSQRLDIQGMGAGSELSVPRDRAPQLGKSSCLYPCLRSITPGLQDRKQEVNLFDSQAYGTPDQSCYHGNTTDDHLWLSGALQTSCCEDCRLIMKKVFSCSTCTQRTEPPLLFPRTQKHRTPLHLL